MLSCEYCKIFKKIYFEEDLPTASSETTEKAIGQKLGFKGFKLKESAFNKLCA